MSSRREQKEALRRERLEREKAAKAAQRRKQMFGYGVGGALVLAGVVIVAVALLAGGGGDDPDKELYPSGVSIPDPGELSADVEGSAKAAGCEYSEQKGTTREHSTDPEEAIQYPTNPPTQGRHYEIPAEDGVYNEMPDKEDLVHTLEHGRVIIWFKPTISGDARGALKTLFDEDDYQLVLTPNDTGMKSAVAASAWNREPVENGTGRLLSCPEWNDKVIDALRAFRDDNRGNGPEPIP